MTESEISGALFRSLMEAPPLLNDLPEGAVFSCESLTMVGGDRSLNLKRKLGYIYEDALAEMLEASARYELLERGLQLRRVAGHTLGELDFLVRDLESACLLHLELAVKFYLVIETANGFLLPGPDARDNFFRKLGKMRIHQLLLTQKFRELLPDKYASEEIVVRQLVHGCVFDHVNANRPVKVDFLNAKGRSGKWLHAWECGKYFGKDVSLEIVPKPLWPVPLELLRGVELEKWRVDEGLNRCVMVRADQSDVSYFIAPDDYP